MIRSRKVTAGPVRRVFAVVVAPALLFVAGCGSSSSSTKASSSSTTGNASTTTPAAANSTVLQQARVFAFAPKGATKPDDITILNGLLYVTYQNNAGKDGTPAGSKSTIVAFNQHTAAVVATWSVLGRCDGLTADPTKGRLLASVNEDASSSLYVITPGNPTPAHYTYSPSPEEKGSDGSNGGTDAISVSPSGTIYVAHSNPESKLPAPNNAAAVYTMTLSGSTATLTRLFGVNDPAQVLNPAPGGPASEPLGLTDPDSNRFVADLGGGTLIQDAQADSKLVLITKLASGQPSLAQLKLTNAEGPASTTPQLDDIEEIGGVGTLYAVDQGTYNILEIPTTAAEQGTFVVSQPKPASGDLANVPGLGVLDTHSGVVTKIDRTFGSPKGLLFVKG